MITRGKVLSVVVLVLLLTSALALAFNIQLVKANGTIYIRADGSVDPSTAPISSIDNVTYTFTSNINDSIVVERDNIVVDGAGYTVQGTGSGTGLSLSGRSNVTIKNTNIGNSNTGIWLDCSSGNSVSGNNITNNWAGIWLYCSSGNSISGNNITANNAFGIELYPSSSNNSISGNNITANNAFGIELYPSSSNNSISGNNITANNWAGILLSSSSNNSIYHNNFVDNTPQVYLDGSENYQNVWDNGYPSGGNYWSDHAGVDVYSGPYQNETGSDGMGDTPYVIDAGNQDNYPLMKAFPWNQHDTAVTMVSVSKTVCGQGYDLPINITVMNYGAYTESFNVTVYANATIIGEAQVSLNPAEETTITFKWNTTGLAFGNYSISAFASPVEGETCLADNTLVDGWVYVSTPGDINGDQWVNAKDAVLLGISFGSTPIPIPVPPWNANADINDDGIVNAKDAVILGAYFGESW